MIQFLFICISFFTAAVSSADTVVETHSYKAAVTAFSKGKEKTISAKINNQHYKNTLLLTVQKKADGSLEVSSGKFKLGKMPVAASFSFILPKESAVKNELGLYTADSVRGIYKVLFSKSDAVFTGFFNEKSCNLTLRASKKGKTVEMNLTTELGEISTE